MRDVLNAPDRSKVQYETPTLTRIGTFETITQHAAGGGFTDAAFPSHTPAGSLSFSD
jgi:hypothetical protein